MSERAQQIAAFLHRLHEGQPADEVREEFRAALGAVRPDELAEAEALLAAKGISVEEIQRFSTEHTRLLTPQMQADPGEEAGHPLTVFRGENLGFSKFLRDQMHPALARFQDDPGTQLQELRRLADEFAAIFRHYERKENLLFPYLEARGITVPPKVMWGVDDVIRHLHGLWTAAMEDENPVPGRIALTAGRTLSQAGEMVEKEDGILLPMLQASLDEEDWILVAQESEIIGYAFNQGVEGASVSDARTWLKEKRGGASRPAADEPGRLSLPSGNLTTEELVAMLNTLPTDLTFVDRDDIIRYYSEGKHQVFTRTRTIIGRDLYLCHPPQLVPVIRKLIEAFRAGTKDAELVPMRRGNRLDLVRYYAVRDEAGNYLGTVEVTEEMSEILEILE